MKFENDVSETEIRDWSAAFCEKMKQEEVEKEDTTDQFREIEKIKLKKKLTLRNN